MKYINSNMRYAIIAIAVLSFTACKKSNGVEPVGDRGQTIVKLVNGGSPGFKSYAIDFVPIPVQLNVADLRRDVPNNAELNKTLNVTIKDDTAALRAYDPTLIYLPAAFYTIGAATPKTGGKGGLFNIVMSPGEFAKPINITIPDATVLDPSSNYGLAFTISSIGAGAVLSDEKTIVIKIGAKNKYDGVYSMRGFHNRPGYQFPYLQEMYMVTTGGSEVAFFWPAANSFGHPIGTGPDITADFSWYGASIGPRVVFNPATDLVTNVYNAGGATPIDIYPGPGSGQGRFEAATKKMYVYWRYNANNDRGFMDTLTYIRGR